MKSVIGVHVCGIGPQGEGTRLIGRPERPAGCGLSGLSAKRAPGQLDPTTQASRGQRPGKCGGAARCATGGALSWCGCVVISECSLALVGGRSPFPVHVPCTFARGPDALPAATGPGGWMSHGTWPWGWRFREPIGKGIAFVARGVRPAIQAHVREIAAIPNRSIPSPGHCRSRWPVPARAIGGCEARGARVARYYLRPEA